MRWRRLAAATYGGSGLTSTFGASGTARAGAGVEGVVVAGTEAPAADSEDAAPAPALRSRDLFNRCSGISVTDQSFQERVAFCGHARSGRPFCTVKSSGFGRRTQNLVRENRGRRAVRWHSGRWHFDRVRFAVCCADPGELAHNLIGVGSTAIDLKSGEFRSRSSSTLSCSNDVTSEMQGELGRGQIRLTTVRPVRSAISWRREWIRINRSWARKG